MLRALPVLAIAFLSVAVATAQPPAPTPPSVRLYVEAEVIGLVKEWEGKLYVLADPNAEQARRIEEIHEAPDTCARRCCLIWRPSAWDVPR